MDALFAQNPLRLAQGLTPAAAHQQARTARESLAAYESGTTQPLPQSLVHLADEVRQRAVYKKEYEAKGDYEFVSVPIESLLAPQINVDLDYVDDLSKTLPSEPSDEVDFAFAFPTGEIAEPIVKGNTVVFTSYAPNIAVTPIPILRRTPEGFEVIIEAKSRPNFVLIARVAGRLVLHNGVHKILALKARGRTHAFGVAYDVPQAANLGLPQAGLSMFSDPNFVQATRAALGNRLQRTCRSPSSHASHSQRLPIDYPGRTNRSARAISPIHQSPCNCSAINERLRPRNSLTPHRCNHRLTGKQ